jgi:hypothetical protein
LCALHWQDVRLKDGKLEITPAPIEETHQAILAPDPARSWKEAEQPVAGEGAGVVAREGLG